MAKSRSAVSAFCSSIAEKAAGALPFNAIALLNVFWRSDRLDSLQRELVVSSLHRRDLVVDCSAWFYDHACFRSAVIAFQFDAIGNIASSVSVAAELFGGGRSALCTLAVHCRRIEANEDALRTVTALLQAGAGPIQICNARRRAPIQEAAANRCPSLLRRLLQFPATNVR
jgi:hypothetical protein